MRVNAERLLRAREAAGLSRAELSKRIGLSVPSIWRIECGKQKPGADVVGAWATACNVGVETLYEEGDTTESAA